MTYLRIYQSVFSLSDCYFWDILTESAIFFLQNYPALLIKKLVFRLNLQ